MFFHVHHEIDTKMLRGCMFFHVYHEIDTKMLGEKKEEICLINIKRKNFSNEELN